MKTTIKELKGGSGPNSALKTAITVFSAVVISLLNSPESNAETTTYYCGFPKWSDEDGTYQTENFNLTFIVDPEKDAAYMVGNNGTVQVVLVPSEGSTNFFELTDTGNMMTTTIDSQLKAVHSRNSVIFGELVPSQYYGDCEIR